MSPAARRATPIIRQVAMAIEAVKLVDPNMIWSAVEDKGAV
jgi:hypothetical protein